jgi:hypothetical protein
MHCDVTMRNIWQVTDYRCQVCGLVIESYGNLIFHGDTGREIQVTVEHDTLVIPADLRPYYHGTYAVYAIDNRGRNVEYSGGKVTPLLSINEKIRAYESSLEDGSKVVAERLGVSVRTVQSWRSVKAIAL